MFKVLTALSLACTLSLGRAADDEFDKSVAALRAVGGEGQGNVAAGQAMQRLAKSQAVKLPALLSAMDGANPFAVNYIRGAVDVIVGNTLAKGGQLPMVELGEFLLKRATTPSREHWRSILSVVLMPMPPSNLFPDFWATPAWISAGKPSLA